MSFIPNKIQVISTKENCSLKDILNKIKKIPHNIINISGISKKVISEFKLSQKITVKK